MQKGNSCAAMAHRAGRLVRQSNAWKVREGRMTLKALRRWVRSVEREARADITPFQGWKGVMR